MLHTSTVPLPMRYTTMGYTSMKQVYFYSSILLQTVYTIESLSLNNQMQSILILNPKKAHFSKNIHNINVLWLKNSIHILILSFMYTYFQFHVFLTTVQLILINLRALQKYINPIDVNPIEVYPIEAYLRQRCRRGIRLSPKGPSHQIRSA